MASQKAEAYQLAHINEDRSAELIASHAVCLALAGIAIILRLTARRLSRASIAADDYMIILAFIFAAGEVTTTMICVRVGGGKHAVRLSNPEVYAKAAYATEALYSAAIATVKFSVLLLYRRIFPNPRFRAILWLVGTFILCYSVTLFFGVIFQCNPIRGAWDLRIGAQCINLSLLILIMSCLNALTDFITLFLPLPLLWKLQLPNQRKIQLMGIFLLGGFVCIVSVYRTTKVDTISLDDAPWSDVNPAVWSIVECCVGIVSACLPVLRPLFTRVVKARSKPGTPRKRYGYYHDPANAAGIKLENSKASWPSEVTSASNGSDARSFVAINGQVDTESNGDTEIREHHGERR